MNLLRFSLLSVVVENEFKSLFSCKRLPIHDLYIRQHFVPIRFDLMVRLKLRRLLAYYIQGEVI